MTAPGFTPDALRPLRAAAGADAVVVIDQRLLPHRLAFETLTTPEAVFDAIHDMVVRGAPLIGATAAYGLALAIRPAFAQQPAQIRRGGLAVGAAREEEAAEVSVRQH